MRGFFSGSELVSKPPARLLPACGACQLYKSCSSPKLPLSGRGEKGILIVSGNVTRWEDDERKGFVGESFEYLSDVLRDAGISMRRDCWLTHASICHNTESKKHATAAVGHCRPNIVRVIQQLKPTVVILLGDHAINSVIGHLWQGKVESPLRWHGYRIPDQTIDAWVCPTHSPAIVRRSNDTVLERVFANQIHAACSKLTRPWSGNPPDWAGEIEVVLDTDKAARIIDMMREKGGEIGFDYESTCLKPEYVGAEIVSASLSWRGRRTIAYPWHGAAIEATKRILRDPRCFFIASNLKHEQRWTLKMLGIRVLNWAWDTVLGAHVLDNRKGTKSVKFQAYVRLGKTTYDNHIHKYLVPEDGEQLNRIKEVPIHQLLVYNGLDSLLEVFVAYDQMRELTERNEVES